VDGLEWFRGQGPGYYTLINQTLRQCLGRESITEETIRRVPREELAALD
jgi:hypothetical protein